MAPSRTPGQKRQREGDYSAIGLHGRKTGLTVPDLGPRDEDGFEPMGDLFSSPQKGPTPARASGRRHESEDETMEIANGTSDNASSVLRSARRSVNRPPSSRSPQKTSLGGSPRRPVGLGSSPLQNRNSRPARSSLLVPPRRSLNFGDSSANPRPRPANPKETSARNGRAGHMAISKPEGRARKQTYDLLDDDDQQEEEEEEEEEEEGEEEEGEEEEEEEGEGEEEDEEGDDEQEVQQVEDEDGDDGLDDVPAGIDDDLAPLEIDDDIDEDFDIPQDADEQAELEEDSPVPEPQPVKRGVKRRSADLETEQATNTSQQPPTKRGKQAKRQQSAPVEEPFAPEIAPVRDASPITESMAPPKKRGRGRGPGQRNPKARISSTKRREVNNETPTDKNSRSDASGTETKKGQRKAKSRPMLHLQEATVDVEEVAPVVLRSGRTTVKPLAYWRGEQIVYEPPKRIGKDLLPGGYRGVDPGRENAEAKPAATNRRKGGRKKAASREAEDYEDEDQEMWETEGDTPGILKSGVLAWDPELQRGSEDAYEEMELAVTSTALESRLQDDKGKTFRFTKTVTLPFFHSGVVDLPPETGAKRAKNSRKNHMIFWVFSGRVQVDISGTAFSIGAGGMWQVPRGNTYELANPYGRRARIFFAQGSYMDTEEEAVLFAASQGMAQ